MWKWLRRQRVSKRTRETIKQLDQRISDAKAWSENEEAKKEVALRRQLLEAQTVVILRRLWIKGN